MFKRITTTLLAMLMLAMMTSTAFAGNGQGVPDDTTTTGETPSVFDEDVTINADLTVNGGGYFSGGARLSNFAIGRAAFGEIPYPYETIQLSSNTNLRFCFGSEQKAMLQNNGDFTIADEVKWGTGRGRLMTNQGASIELGGTGCIPFIDFSNDMTTDYDMRLILNGDDELKVAGGNLMVEGGSLQVAGDITLGATKRLYAPGRMHIHGEEILYLLNKDGVRVSKSWGGNGNLTVEGSGTFGGTVTTGSSREIKNNISQLSGEEAVEALMSLMPVKYNYKANADELELGFIAEDVPDLVARNDRKSLSPMDFAALSVTVIQELKKETQQQQAQIDQLKALVNELISNK